MARCCGCVFTPNYGIMFFVGIRRGLLAQLVEQLTLNQRVGGSKPSQPIYKNRLNKAFKRFFVCEILV